MLIYVQYIVCKFHIHTNISDYIIIYIMNSNYIYICICHMYVQLHLNTSFGLSSLLVSKVLGLRNYGFRALAFKS